MACGPKGRTAMRDLRFPTKAAQENTISADAFRRYLDRLMRDGFYGECTIRFQGGRIYNVIKMQSFVDDETLNKQIS